MNKKLIKKKLRNSRDRVQYYALDPVKRSIKDLAQLEWTKYRSLYDLSLSNKDILDDISALQESMRVTMVTLLDRSATIITALCCISVALAALLFIILFV